MPGTPTDPVDRLLSRSLRERRGETGEVCPDADRLAAWAEGVLDGREAAGVEAHASSCARCAQILSVVAASDPGPADAARPGFWTVWRAWRWAVPMVTAVVVIGLWFGSTRPEVTRSAEPKAADDAGPPSPGAAAPVTERASSSGPTISPTEARRLPVNLPSSAAGQQAASPPATASPAAVSKETASQRAAPPAPARADERLAEVQQSPTPAARLEGADVREAAPGAPAGRAQAAAEDSAEARPAFAEANRSRQAEPPRDASPQARAAPAAPASRMALDVPLLLVRSTDPNTLWRARGTAIERTTDRGATWRVEYTSGSAVVGGVAVSPDVAWFFGRGGLVLRRTPAGWLVSRMPGDAEISTISATSATEAIVTLAAGGRQLRTADGGATWVPR